MKHCNYCGKEIHEQSSFCPYCMQSQIDKENTVIWERKSGKWLYLLVIGLLLVLLIVLVCFLMRENKEIPENHSDIAIEITETTTITTTTTLPISTTVTATTQAETTTSLSSDGWSEIGMNEYTREHTELFLSGNDREHRNFH